MIIHGNILNIKEGVIVHQVNCKGVMGAGLAKQIAHKYPRVFEKYSEACSKYGSRLLGLSQVVTVSDKLVIVNLFSQNGYGRDKVHTDYKAFNSGLISIKKKIPSYVDIYFPYGIGCGLAGGNWHTIEPIILNVFSDNTNRIKFINYNK